MNKTARSLILTGFILFGIVFSALTVICDGGGRVAENLAKENVKAVANPQDFGNGVYYLSATEATFGVSLANFKEKHPKLRIVAVAENGRGRYGYAIGYFVVVESNFSDCTCK